MKQGTAEKRGFTTPEKWIIWGVFCMLVGLSTERITVFAGLMLLSIGLTMAVRKQRVVLGALLGLVGLVNLIFSKYLV